MYVVLWAFMSDPGLAFSAQFFQHILLKVFDWYLFISKKQQMTNTNIETKKNNS